MLRFFENIAHRLRPSRKQILLGAVIGFVLGIAFVLLEPPKILHASVFLFSWWLWLVYLLIAFYGAQKAGSEDLTGLEPYIPGLQHLFLIVYVVMAIVPAVWLLIQIV